MSMKSEQQEFQQLRRLLALKRHEQPPPGYFKDFSHQVVSQILAARPLGEDSAIEQLGWEAPWLQRLWAAFEAKPLLAGAFGVAVCALLVSGVVYSERTGSASVANLPTIPDSAAERIQLAGTTPAPLSRTSLSQSPAMPASSTEGFSAPKDHPSLFDEIRSKQDNLQNSLVMPVSVPGN
jgi:hypothetical protein